MALAPNLWWLALGRILAGITSSSFTTAFAYMADITAPEKRARAYGLIGAAFSARLRRGAADRRRAGRDQHRARPSGRRRRFSAVAFLYGLFVLPESLPRENRMAFCVEARQSVRRAPAAALAPRADRAQPRQLPALFRAPRLLGGVRALRRLSLRLDRARGRRAAGDGRHSRHDRAGVAGRDGGQALGRQPDDGVRPRRRRDRHRLHGARADRARLHPRDAPQRAVRASPCRPCSR